MDNKFKTLQNINVLKKINCITNSNFHHIAINGSINMSSNNDSNNTQNNPIPLISEYIKNDLVLIDNDNGIDQITDLIETNLIINTSEKNNPIPIMVDSFNSKSQFNQEMIKKSQYLQKYKSEPIITEPIITEPIITEPITEPIITEPIITEPIITEPIITEPITEQITEPIITKSQSEPIITEIITEPIITEIITEPIITKSQSEPIITEIITEPIITEIITEPIITEPIIIEPVIIESFESKSNIFDSFVKIPKLENISNFEDIEKSNPNTNHTEIPKKLFKSALNINDDIFEKKDSTDLKKQTKLITKLITELDIKTEPVSKAKIEPITKAKTEPITKAKIEPITKAKTEPITKAKSELKVNAFDHLIQDISSNIKNNEKLPVDFNPVIYKRLNIDLKNLNIKELIKHYLEIGSVQNRKYKIDIPDNFDLNMYKKLNSDLLELSNEELKIHYIKHGFIESRQYIMSKQLAYIDNLNTSLVTNLVTNLKTDSVTNLKTDSVTNSVTNLETDLDYNKYYADKNMVYIIGNIYQGGGITKYYYDLIRKYQNKTFKYICSKKIFDTINFKSNDIILIKNILNTDISITDLNNKLYNGALLILTIHDFVWLCSNLNIFGNSVHFAYLNSDIKIETELLEFFNKINIIIHPSEFTYSIYSKFFDNTNFIIAHHPDIKLISPIKNIIPEIKNNTINLMVPSKYSIYKGAENINKLMRSYSSYLEYKINFYIIGDTFFNSLECPNCINLSEYEENEFFDLIVKYNIHGLIYLNKWGETWSYCLTKGIISGLPLYYTLNGSYLERINNIDNHFGTIERNYDTDFKYYLDYIIKNQTDPTNPTDLTNPTNLIDNIKMVYPKIYDIIFKTN
jgi:hypothetical protein